MMRKIIFSWFPLFMMVTMFASCSVVRKSSEVRQQDVRAYEPVNYVPFTQPLAAEIKVMTEERVSDTWTFTSKVAKSLHSSQSYGKNQAYDLKVEALAKSVAKYNADMIVAATFDYKKVSNSDKDEVTEEVTIVVSGYPARFVNWRSVEPESKDYNWISDFYGKKIGLTTKESSSDKVMMATPSEMTLIVTDK